MLPLRRPALLLLLATTSCAGTLEVSRTFTPEAAAKAETERLVAIAIVRGDTRVPLPAGARVEQSRIVLPLEPVHVHRLAPGDVIEQDADGRIVAVRSASNPPVVTHFVPGTAESPDGSDFVRGRLAEDSRVVPLQETDAIEMRGQLSSQDDIPGGGRVETSRATGALIGGVALLVITYVPTAYVGAGSHRSSDRVLAIPVAGPWIDLAQRSACTEPVLPIKPPVDPCIQETASRAALVASGALQGLGAVLTVVGLPSRVRVVDGTDHGVSFEIVPTAGGAAAVGTF